MTFPAVEALQVRRSESILLAAVKTCIIEATDSLDVPYYSNLSAMEVVDMTCVQCVVRRAKINNRWAIIDRSGNLARAIYDGDTSVD
ncbi:hypothetical protein SERLA73DRAFT_183186 [Serpula lacrymans var. lacrymans S7.3]|uniref:Uncharacterized protein n=2 Tax=Serpula lacrymans var. lacrymans TaxID=341189 RepID=F8PZD1_SERL3|nr:uncharacterized protein SERLADRAFT_470215 [Serpula lacrymans var. lacrymans S7.9]EGN98253.1 hypothetical protein SERLA73DRAFT_183186 [Serpula lacrymans var. lacrymans S7.3]EGO23825.1 hypothetical protein SERLADRAFT_470215 [Serpula lacrymans var. lacrymans S7.9]